VSTANIIANHLVNLASLASIDLDLFLDKNVSVLPEIAVDRPALFPDCINTMAIMVTQDIICKTTTTIARALISKPLLNENLTKNVYRIYRQATS